MFKDFIIVYFLIIKKLEKLTCNMTYEFNNKREILYK